MNKNYHFNTLDDLFNALTDPNYWNKQETQQKTTPKTTNNTVGNVFNESSINQAIKQYEDEINAATEEYNKKIEEKNERINQLKARLVNEQMKTRIVRNGSDMAITMVVENARKVADSLNNLLNQENVPEKITITIPNVG